MHVLTFLDHSQDAPYAVHVLPDIGNVLFRASAMSHKAASISADAFYDTGVAWSADVLQPHAGSAIYSERQCIDAFGPILRLRAALSPRAIWRRKAMMKLEQTQLDNAGKIVAVSGLVERLLNRQYGIPQTAISVIHNGVDTSRFDRSHLQRRRDFERASLGIHDNEIIFLVLANNLMLKGVDLVIRACGLLRKKGYSGARLVVAGANPDRKMLTLIDQENVAGITDFVGHVEDVTALLAAADVFMHITRWDACSLVTIEAMASGLPVVTTSRNGAAELINPSIDGIVLSDPENVENLVETMLSLFDHDLRHKLGANAYQSAQRFDININFQKVEQLLLSRQ